jgi:branched-chain amino acid aminotransferase
MHATVNVNGKITDAASAVISVFDRGFLFGEGVYETLRTYNSHLFLLERHFKRFRASAESISLPVPLDDAAFKTRIDETIAAANIAGELYIRLILTRGVGELSYDPASCQAASLVIIVKAHAEQPPEVRARGVAIIISSVLRNHPKAINPLIKSNNLLNNALAMQEALRNGAAEALMRNHRGEIAECAQSNFFIVRNGAAFTPPLESGLLEGVTRNFVFEVGNEVGIPVREAVLADADLAAADEMFLTSTTREVLPITRIDGREVGAGLPGQITLTLADAFRRKADALTRT